MTAVWHRLYAISIKLTTTTAVEFWLCCSNFSAYLSCWSFLEQFLPFFRSETVNRGRSFRPRSHKSCWGGANGRADIIRTLAHPAHWRFPCFSQASSSPDFTLKPSTATPHKTPRSPYTVKEPHSSFKNTSHQNLPDLLPTPPRPYPLKKISNCFGLCCSLPFAWWIKRRHLPHLGALLDALQSAPAWRKPNDLGPERQLSRFCKGFF